MILNESLFEEYNDNNGQYYVTFYDNGKYKLEESLTEAIQARKSGYVLVLDGDKVLLDDELTGKKFAFGDYNDSETWQNAAIGKKSDIEKLRDWAYQIYEGNYTIVEVEGKDEKALYSIGVEALSELLDIYNEIVQFLKAKSLISEGDTYTLNDVLYHFDSLSLVLQDLMSEQKTYAVEAYKAIFNMLSNAISQGKLERNEVEPLIRSLYETVNRNITKYSQYLDAIRNQKKINESLLQKKTVDIDKIETPEQLMTWMEENITYELANDEYGAEDDPPTKTAEEVIETGTGHCAEQSYLEYKVLDDLGYFPQLIFVKENNSENDYGADGSAHMFVIYQDDDEKYTYFEHSQEHNKGIHKFDSMSELLDFVGKNWWRYDANSDILEVRYIDEPITGVDNWKLAQECHKYEVDEVLDISNNVMEKDVPLDAKWDYDKHKIMEKNSIMKIKSILIEDNNLKCEYCGTLLSSQDLKCPSCGASRQETLDHYKELKAKAAKQKEDSKKKWVAYIIDWHDSKDIKTIASNRFFNLSEVLNWLRSYKNYSDIKSGTILIEMGNEYRQKEIPINNGKVTIPNEAELVKSNKYNVQTLNEAKKRKKKISQINPGEAIFKSVKDMQKWVKKRQKGWGSFVHIDNCGNMDYNNDMFNKMHGLGDASSSSTADGGASDAAPSGGDVGVGMGESLEMNKDVIKLSPNLVQFMKEHRDLINKKDWDTLFLDYAEDELSEEDQSQLVQVLISIGCDIEVIE